MIRMENIWKVYRAGDINVEALMGIDLKIKEGDFVSIMGASGSGKSTLLHIMGVLDRPTRGEVHINGTDVDELSNYERTEFRLKNLGFVFQFYALLPELNAIENVYLPNLLLTKEGGYRERGKETLDLLGLKNRYYNYPHQLSGGEQQRVAIARALINKPHFLLADEPTASLDSKTSRDVINLFKKLNEKLKITVVLITHEQDIGKLAQRGIWLKDGKIEKEKRF